ncbi:NmrA family NAD(P)-binding protein [Xanthocytophaga flava]|uniref:NmrA family NAD(P)-binding protein n=1 Tax=Xanthocytophaga flava TaxID=3048013 RepID=UPI0028D27036|nr:NAD(P)H-binding protein [Xanthocytophaga flavus]MDJ1467237.1 NAD(P)H-binding protein [Xanthocytophaga flavus]
MKIVITGSLGNVSRRLTEQLIQKGHIVTVISHDSSRVKAIEEIGATAAIGSIEDADFLIQTFLGADAVYTMVPPNYHTPDYQKFVTEIGKTYAQAIRSAEVSYVVNLSSIGAHNPDSNGPSGTFFYEEEQLNQLSSTNVLHLRAGMFYTNFYRNIDMIKHRHIIGNNFDGTLSLAMTHPYDIADVATEALDKLSFTGKEVQYVVSDEKRGTEIAEALGEAVNKPDLQWIVFPDKKLQEAMTENGFSSHMASKFAELGVAIREGRLFSHYQANKPLVFGKRKFTDFVKEFAIIYRQSM